jgi:hypothetical protein
MFVLLPFCFAGPMSNGTWISTEDHAFFCRCNWFLPPPPFFCWLTQAKTLASFGYEEKKKKNEGKERKGDSYSIAAVQGADDKLGQTL